MRRPPRAAAARPAPLSAVLLPAALVCAALVCLRAAPPSAAQTPGAKGSPPPATATVAGRVTTNDGKPVAGVVVALMPAEFNPLRSALGPRATTGEDGKYRIANVAAGRYRLQAVAPLYSSPEDRGNSSFNAGRVLTVGAGESVEGIDLTLVRGGVITGRVTTQEGRPVIGERVLIAGVEQAGPGGFGNFGFSPFEFETDDRGVYRVYGVPPGRYLVSVGLARDSGMVVVGPNAPQYQRTFHPNVTDPAQAKPVEVTSGGEAAGVDIEMAAGPKVYEARGRVLDEEGRAVAGVGFGYGTVRPGQRSVGSWGTDGSVTNEAGEFVVRNLTPGHYAVFAAADFGMTPLDVYSDTVQFEVTDANVEGLVVKVHRGASISGTVVVEGTTDRAVLSKVSQLNLAANVGGPPGTSAPPDQLAAPSFAQGHVSPDGTFRLAGLRPGRVVINVFAFGETRGFTLLGVQRAGADASAGIDIGEGEQVTGVRLRLGYGTGVIRGQIDLRNAGEPMEMPAGARINVTARRVGAPTAASNSGGDADSRGRFVIEGLIGGEYELTAFVFIPRQPGSGPPTRPQPLRHTVSVPDGGEITVSLIYDISKQTERTP